MSGYGGGYYNPYALYALQQQGAQNAANGYMSPNGYGYGTTGSRGSAQGYQINPPQTSYGGGDPNSLWASMASVLNNQNSNQTQYNIAEGNANAEMARLNQQLLFNQGQTVYRTGFEDQWNQRQNDTQRYGYDTALQGQLGVADRNMQTQLGTAGMALQGQLGAANIGANAQNYGNQLQAQTALSGQQNALNIANLQNQGGITQANIAANAQMLPANLRQQRFNDVLPIFDALLGYNRPAPAAGGSPVATSPAPASPAPQPAPQTPMQQRSADGMQLMNQINANGRGNDPNLVGSAAWQARQANAAGVARANAAAARPALTANMRASQAPTTGGANGTRPGVGLSGFNGAAANTALRQQLSRDLSGVSQATPGAQAQSPGAPSAGTQPAGKPMGGSSPGAFRPSGGNVGGGAGNPNVMFKGGNTSGEGGMFGTAGTGPVAGGLPMGTAGPGTPSLGAPEQGVAAGGLPMGAAGPGTPSLGAPEQGVAAGGYSDPRRSMLIDPVATGLPMGTPGPGAPGGASPSALPFGEPLPSAPAAPSLASPAPASAPAADDWRARMNAARDAQAASLPQASQASSPAAPGAAPSAAPASPGDAQTINPPTGLAALLGGSSSSSGGAPVGTQPPIQAIPPSTPQMWQQRVNQAVGQNSAQMAQLNNDLMRSSAARYGTNSRATQSMMNQNNARLVGMNQQARTGIPMQGMQQYSDYMLNLQRAQEEQYANRQREAIQRSQISAGSIAPLLQALSSFSG